MAQLETYYYSDQLTTCPNCGSRTDVLLDMSYTTGMVQVEDCLGCGNKFLLESDPQLQL